MASICTRGGWHVSSTSGHGIDGAILHVIRRKSRGDHDGRLFASADLAHAFALERGYTMRYFFGSPPASPTDRAWRRDAGRIIAHVLKTADKARVSGLADFFYHRALDRGWDHAQASRMRSGVMWAARNLHPDFKPAWKR